jgi:L-iditol 2-dehydrogenase
MKAAVFEGKDNIVVQEVPDPVLRDGELLLEIEACCICGADLRTYRHGHAKITPPRILGHEFCGTVVETRATEGPSVGDRVVMYIVIPCGQCKYCRAGRANLCVSRATMSYDFDGAFATHMKVPAKAVAGGHLFKVEADISSREMAISEPLGCAINAHHNRLNIGLKDVVAVIGAGPIGVMHALLARLQGAQKVFILDTSESRLEMAKAFDLDERIIVSSEGGHIERVKELTDGFGADVVIVACGSPHAQIDSLEIAAKAGRVEFFGGLPKSSPTAQLNTNHLHYKEITVSGSFSEKMSDFQAAQALVQSGRFPADKIVNKELPLEVITDGFHLMEEGKALKACINPQL